MGVPTPTIQTFWNMAVMAHTDSGSVLASTLVLKRLSRPFSVYEIHSLRASISTDGGGDVASHGWMDRGIPEAMGNDDNVLMGVRTDSPPGGGPVGNVFIHHSRSLQREQAGDPTIYLPPGFYWDGELHGITQNGAGAVVTWLFTVMYRIVTFTQAAFPDAISKMPPRTITKSLTNS